MASLPYMQFYVSDYLADTAHLTAAQHGAYLLLIFNYWQRGKPLNNSNERLTNVARMSNEEWAENKAAIAEFFVIDGDEWRHTRIEDDLSKVCAKSTKASAAGKASASKRSTNVQQSFNERSTDIEQTLNHKDKDKDKDKEEDKETTTTPRKREASTPLEVNAATMQESGISQELASEYLRYRKTKKSPLTPRAWSGILKEIGKANLSVEDGLEKSMSRGWIGFEAEWLVGKIESDKTPQQLYEARMRAAL